MSPLESGKSSIVLAGVIPRLEDLGWRVLEPIKPGTEPLETLRSQVLNLYIGDVLDPPGCRPTIPGNEPILIVIDQFEELFTLCRDRDKQSQFIDFLLDLPESGRIKAVITMRADFLEACLAYPALTQAIQTHQVLLSRMAEADLEAAIVNPAKLQGMSLQPKLLARILQDVEKEENCLPLLEFALQQLWDQRSGTELTFDAYRKLDGVTGALNAHAEEIYKQLAARKQEEWAKRVLLRLVRTGEGTKDTRQRQAKLDLLAMGKDAGEKEAIASVIMTLDDGRLLVSDRIDGQDVIDLRHEALMFSWKQFVGWRESDRETRRLVDKIEDAKREWQTHQKRKYLLDGRLLRDAKRLLKDKPEAVLGAKAFIEESAWWWELQLAGLMLISPLILGLILGPILGPILGIPTEYFWREETVKRDYDRINLLENGDAGERAAVLNIAGGCWAAKPFKLVPQYLRERVFGNCRSLQNSNLEKADLKYANLSGANLGNANLSGTDFLGANLSGANLGNANLSGTDFLGANLSGANLGNANLSGANLSGANLGNANLSDADFSVANLSGANLGNANLSRARFTCYESTTSNQQKVRECPTLKDIKWNEETKWQGIQGWENVENIPPKLKQQLKLKNVK